MKKTVLLFAIIICVGVAHAQGIRMGLNASPQVSWLKSDNAKVSTDGMSVGFNFGLQTDFFFSERYAFSTGLAINNTGGTLRYEEARLFQANQEVYVLDPGASVKYKIQYIDIPLAFRMESNQIGYFVYFAQFGVTNHVRVGSSADISSASVNVNGVGCKNEVAFYNMGYNVGLGANYYFSQNTAITAGVVYNNGFIDVTDDAAVSDAASLRSIMLKIGVIF